MAEIIQLREDLLAFSSAGFFGSVWWAQPTAEMIHAVYQARLRQEAKYPGEFVMLTLLKIPKLRSMSPDAREATRETRRGMEVFCRADASAVESEMGVLGESMARVALAAVNLMSRSNLPNKLFTNRTEAIRWLASFARRTDKEMLAIVEEALRTKE